MMSNTLNLKNRYLSTICYILKIHLKIFTEYSEMFIKSQWHMCYVTPKAFT